MDTHPTPDTPPYDLLGGEAAVRKLHPQDLSGSREKLFMFLSGWLGGPPLYVERHGHPRLRARHLPFAIGVAERDAWIACMTQAMQDCGVEEGMRKWLLQSLFGTADWMRNQPAEGQER